MPLSAEARRDIEQTLENIDESSLTDEQRARVNRIRTLIGGSGDPRLRAAGQGLPVEGDPIMSLISRGQIDPETVRTAAEIGIPVLAMLATRNPAMLARLGTAGRAGAAGSLIGELVDPSDTAAEAVGRALSAGGAAAAGEGVTGIGGRTVATALDVGRRLGLPIPRSLTAVIRGLSRPQQAARSIGLARGAEREIDRIARDATLMALEDFTPAAIKEARKRMARAGGRKAVRKFQSGVLTKIKAELDAAGQGGTPRELADVLLRLNRGEGATILRELFPGGEATRIARAVQGLDDLDSLRQMIGDRVLKAKDMERLIEALGQPGAANAVLSRPSLAENFIDLISQRSGTQRSASAAAQLIVGLARAGVDEALEEPTP